jgi:hypothetical protein
MDINGCKTILSIFENGLNNIVSDYDKFILSHIGLSEKRDIILKEYENGKDNIFSSVFKFRLENFHSEMLRQILDKNEPSSGCVSHIRPFPAKSGLRLNIEALPVQACFRYF